VSGKNRAIRDLEKWVTLMASSSSDLEDEGFGFFTDDDDLPVAAAADPDVEVFDLGSTLTIKNVDQWHGRFESALGGVKSIKIEAAALDQVDGTGLQLLCSLFTTAREIELSIGWGETSARLGQSAGFFGAYNVLGIDSHKNAA
jgi:ABC-type transporter Mla MlaB component